MFSPNCVIVLPSPEIAIKGNSVRAFMQKRLKKNMGLYLKYAKAPFTKMITSAGRIFVYTSEPKRVALALKNCFGINGVFVSEEMKFSTLAELCLFGAEASKGIIEEGTFAVRGKSFSKAFSSKKLEEELGGSLLDAYPKLKVRLRGPEKELFCVAFEEKAFFYFESLPFVGGMPVGVQGTAGLIVLDSSNELDLVEIAKNLLKTGCSVVLVGDKVPKSISKIEDFNCFKPFKHFSVEEAKQAYSTKDISAFFSAAKSEELAKKDSDLVGVKAFAPLLF